jgi:hypothetical protein
MRNFKKKALSIIGLFFVTIVYGFVVHNNQVENSFVLSSRFFHPRGNQDSESTLQAIKELSPKRIDWVYHDSDQVLKEYKNRGLPFSLTLNPQLPDSAGYSTLKYRIRDYQGKSYTAPWMKEWKIKNPYWGCVNNPMFYKLFLDRSLFLASKGPYTLFVDDAIFNERLCRENLGGCFCKFCIKKFSEKKSSDLAKGDVFKSLKKSISNQL